METRSYTILADNKSQVEYRIRSLNKKAIKLGLPEITITYGKAYLEKREVLSSDPIYTGEPPRYIKKELLIIPVEVTGPFEVKYDGWEFVAVLDHFSEGNIIRKIIDIDIPNKYRSTTNCEHCNIHRKRNGTYLLRNQDKLIQVGSTCIKDFLGGNSPDNIINRADFACDIISVFEAGDSLGTSSGDLFSLQTFIANTIAVVAKYGWVSSKIAKERGIFPTYRLVQYNMFGWNKDFERVEVTEADKEKATEVLEWAENLSDEECNNDYMHNIRTLARSGYASLMTSGIAASIVSAYRNAKEVKEKVLRTPSKHIGVVKERRGFELTVKTFYGFDGSYGISYKYIMEDKEGNVFVWTTNNNELKEGETYKLKATIKGHTKYREVEQTVLTRCSI